MRGRTQADRNRGAIRLSALEMVLAAAIGAVVIISSLTLARSFRSNVRSFTKSGAAQPSASRVKRITQAPVALPEGAGTIAATNGDEPIDPDEALAELSRWETDQAGNPGPGQAARAPDEDDRARSGDLYTSSGSWDEEPGLHHLLASEKSQQDTAEAQAARLQPILDLIASGDFSPQSLRKAFENITEEDIGAALALVSNMEWGPQADGILQGLMARWGQMDGAAALAYADRIGSRQTRNAAVKNALLSWSKTDPEAAFDWLAGQPDVHADALQQSVKPLFQMLLSQNPEQAFSKIWELPNAAMKRAAAYTVIPGLSKEQNAAQMESLFAQVSGDQDLSILAEAMITSWTPYQPEIAASWTKMLDDPDVYGQAVDRLVTTWGKDQPEEAADWVLDITDDALRKRQLSKLTQSWVQVDPMATSEWLAQFPPSPELDPAVQNLVRATMKKDPANAMTWADSVTNKKQREKLMFQVGHLWVRSDPPSASAYIAASDLPRAYKNRLLAQAGVN